MDAGRLRSTSTAAPTRRLARGANAATAIDVDVDAPLTKLQTAKTLGAGEPRKRQRGALQDISNQTSNTGKAGAKKLAKTAISKAPAKPKLAPVKANATRRLPRATTAKSVANAVAAAVKNASAAVPIATRKRKHEGEHAAAVPAHKRQTQTSLLSFQSITANATRKPVQEAAKQAQQKVTVKAETAEVPSIAKQASVERTERVKAEPAPQEPPPEPFVPIEFSPYVPRRPSFVFDHRDSGFDAETYRSQISDIDAAHRDSARYCGRIALDIARFHSLHETKYMPQPDYIGTTQPDISEKMRTILIDWLVEVGEEYDLDSRTFHKAVNLVDRCLAKFKITRKQFQLLGCACMMVAAKYEEVYGPNVDEFVYISDQTYTSEEMLEMEKKVLAALEYRIASTTCHGFLERFMRAGCDTEAQKTLVLYLSDFALLYYHMLKYKPSEIAASAVYLSRLMTKQSPAWTPTLHHLSQYNPWDLKACIEDLHRAHRAENAIVNTDREKIKAVSEKYLAEKFHAVSTIAAIEDGELEQSFLAFSRRRPASASESTTL